ncbi:MAG: hypothetical protein IJ092_10010 [Atopobiaceae bacterium]|nr:hypothetical protein [Atopobiaceae bacterium]
MVIYHDMYYAPADATRKLHIYLPQGYDASEERYPVMYMFDGHNLFFDEHATYGKSWGLKEFLDAWEKRMIVVGMECSHEGTARLDEYGPYPTTIMGHKNNPMGEQTFQWIISVVKPWADANLRTWPHREATGIGGSSMGGIMSLYGVIVHNDVFGKAACLAPGARIQERRVLRDLKAHGLNPDTRVYLSFGEDEKGRTKADADPAVASPEAKAEARVCAELESYGAVTRTFFQAGGHHCEASWEQQNARYMDFLWLDR